MLGLLAAAGCWKPVAPLTGLGDGGDAGIACDWRDAGDAGQCTSDLQCPRGFYCDFAVTECPWDGGLLPLLFTVNGAGSCLPNCNPPSLPGAPQGSPCSVAEDCGGSEDCQGPPAPYYCTTAEPCNGECWEVPGGVPTQCPNACSIISVPHRGPGCVCPGNTCSVPEGPRCGPDAAPCFGPPFEVIGDTTTWGLATADFNHDGIDDLIKVGQGSTPWAVLGSADGTTVYFGISDGGLVPARTFEVTGAHYAAVGDLNGDGWSDVLTVGQYAIDTEVNLRDTTFYSTVISITSYNAQLAIADFDGDGRADLAACALGVSIYFDDGGSPYSPSYKAPATVMDPAGFSDAGAVECRELATGDLNGDGIPDILAHEAEYRDGFDPQHGIVVLLGYGDGGFSETTYLSSSVTMGLAVSDLNGDGRPDVVYGGNGGLIVRLNQGGGILGPEQHWALDSTITWPVQQVVVADLDGDQRPDLAVAVGNVSCFSYDGGAAFYLLDDGDGGFGPGEPLVTGSQSITSITAWRASGARLPDLVVGDGCRGSVFVLQNHFADAGS